MSKHGILNADRFVDKFKGQEPVLKWHVGQWNGHIEGRLKTLDVPDFKEFLVNGDGSVNDNFLEGLCRAYDLSTERGYGVIIRLRTLQMPAIS